MSDGPRAAGSGRTVLRWFAAALTASFVAGAGVGSAVTRLADRPRAEAGDRNAAIVQNLVENYGLTREQARQVRLVLMAKDAELQAILNRNRSLLPEPIRREVGRVHVVAEERIRNVLNAEQRRRFLQDSRLGPAAETDRNDSSKED